MAIMAKKVSATARTASGREVRVYGELTADGSQVAVWSKAAHHGFYNLSRFDGGTLTASSFRKLLGVES
ncbi:hypothetical protein SEA_DEJAVU_118 [Microbacterium Phage DejaVu]|nr:hypothetical protein SEA_DEJAVU_2 [Microbacterium Phage DejaVu]WNM66250.1 hypothetical protein SEA_DEJAVU_118 [Microbacterium Phage DejaVu]